MKKFKQTILRSTQILAILFLSNFSLVAQSDNILSVDGMDFGAGVVIMWETLDAPKNEQSFIVERAMDADSDFEKIGEVTTEADGKMKQFSFEDRELGLKKAFYRIKILEKNAGIESYSEVIPVVKDVINNFRIQNTEQVDKNQYQVSVLSVVEDKLKFQLATNMGEIVMKQTYDMKIGENDFLVDLEMEADGSYVVSFQNGSYTITKNFSKKTEKSNNVARKD